VAHETPLFAPLNQSIEQLFSTLCKDERRPVFVADENGELQGMLTLEDMLEELVGEIHDEIDNKGTLKKCARANSLETELRNCV